MPDPVPWLVLWPLAWAAAAFVAGPVHAPRIGVVASLVHCVPVVALTWRVGAGGAFVHRVGGWGAPLGIDLVADGIGCVMVATIAVVALAIALYAIEHYGREPEGAGSFWPLAGLLVAGLDALVLSGDVFNVYVCLEVTGLAAVGLVASPGTVASVAAAARYLFATLAASGAWLLGVALLYAAYGTVSLDLLGAAIRGDASLAAPVAAVAMTLGLLVKGALAPFHAWLPPAHGHAPAPVSALLSALVVAAPFTIAARLWLGPFAPLLGPAAGLVLGALGAGAVALGSSRALLAPRLKVLVAWSTVAQVGYFFLLFPLAADGDPRAVAGIFLHVVSHALAKSAMFAAAGTITLAMGGDRVDALGGVAARLPSSAWTFALAGLTLTGLPPSGGFFAKWLLLAVAVESGRWWVVLVLLGGGLATAAYLARLFRCAFLPPPEGPFEPSSPARDWPPLALALGSVLLGLCASPLVTLVATR